jgi:hypothetical protein
VNEKYIYIKIKNLKKDKEKHYLCELPKTKDMLIKDLEKTKYKKYIPKIDEIVEKLSEEKLKSVLEKINKIDLENPKFEKYRDLLEYFKYKILVKM